MSKPITKKSKPNGASPGIGHNSGEVSGARLKSFIERVERLEEEKKTLAQDIREIYSEAKGAGYDTKIMKKTVRLRAMDAEKRREEQELLDLYCAALGLA
jgi:uncharacterized protein (UPF0335 family)